MQQRGKLLVFTLQNSCQSESVDLNSSLEHFGVRYLDSSQYFLAPPLVPARLQVRLEEKASHPQLEKFS